MSQAQYAPGIPSRVTQYADSVKQKFAENATKSSIRERTESLSDLPVLPPGVSRDQFNTAIEELRGIVDQQDVQIIDGALDDGWYLHRPLSHDIYALDDEDYFINSAVCAPSSVEQVQAVVHWANKWLIPLYPVSMGRNFGYGGAAGRVKGSVIVDMGKNMNRVLELDEKSAYCLLEPGVSYYVLYDEIKKSKKKLWVDVPDLGGGSVIGNALDRGVGYTPYGVWLMPDPGGHQTLQITFPREDDLHQIVEIMRPLKINNIISNVPHLRHIMQEASVYGDRKSFWEHDGPIPEDRIDDVIVPKLWMGNFRWILYLCVYGPEHVRQSHIKIIKDAFYQIPGAKLMYPEDTPAESYLRSRVKIYSGTPDLRELDWVMWLPNGSHTAFSPISPITGDDAVKQYTMTKKLHQKWGFDYFPTFCPGAREMHHIVMIIYDRYNPESKARAKGLMKDLIDEGARLGMGEYRTHLALQDRVMGTYNFNNSALLKMHNQLKDALDPNGIMAPGKSGIWGSRWQITGSELMPIRVPATKDEEQSTQALRHNL